MKSIQNWPIGRVLSCIRIMSNIMSLSRHNRNWYSFSVMSYQTHHTCLTLHIQVTIYFDTSKILLVGRTSIQWKSVKTTQTNSSPRKMPSSVRNNEEQSVDVDQRVLRHECLILLHFSSLLFGLAKEVKAKACYKNSFTSYLRTFWPTVKQVLTVVLVCYYCGYLTLVKRVTKEDIFFCNLVIYHLSLQWSFQSNSFLIVLGGWNHEADSNIIKCSGTK